jgi:hypothetical protein
MMRVREAELLTRLRNLHSTWPLQSRLAYLWR